MILFEVTLSAVGRADRAASDVPPPPPAIPDVFDWAVDATEAGLALVVGAVLVELFELAETRCALRTTLAVCSGVSSGLLLVWN